MDLNDVRVFVRVVQAGSFSQAAKTLGMPNSTVSAKVAALEEGLGVQLLTRTTRKLSLTEEGKVFYRHSTAGLEEILRGENELGSAQGRAHGVLKVTAPVDMGASGLADLVPVMRKRYPDVTLDFLFTDRLVDLIGEGIDVAIRAGELRDSAFLAKKLGEVCWALFASPAYLKSAAPLAHPKDLRKHRALQFAPMGEDAWTLKQGAASVTVPIAGVARGNDVNWIKALALEGQGVALMPTFLTHADLKAKRLVRVLPGWNAALDPIHLVYPAQKFVPAKVRAFVEIASETLRFD